MMLSDVQKLDKSLWSMVGCRNAKIKRKQAYSLLQYYRQQEATDKLIKKLEWHGQTD